MGVCAATCVMPLKQTTSNFHMSVQLFCGVHYRFLPSLVATGFEERVSVPSVELVLSKCTVCCG